MNNLSKENLEEAEAFSKKAAESYPEGKRKEAEAAILTIICGMQVEVGKILDNLETETVPFIRSVNPMASAHAIANVAHRLRTIVGTDLTSPIFQKLAIVDPYPLRVLMGDAIKEIVDLTVGTGNQLTLCEELINDTKMD